MLYKCTNIYDPNDEYGIKWDDPELDIQWGDISPLFLTKIKIIPLKESKNLPQI